MDPPNGEAYAAFSRDGSHLAVAGGNKVLIYSFDE
jgi:hypothetical protein